LRVSAPNIVQLFSAQGRLFQLEQRGLEVEQRRVGAEEYTMRRQLREQVRDAAHTFEHGNLNVNLARCDEVKQRLCAQSAQRVQEHQPKPGRLLDQIAQRRGVHGIDA